MMDHRMTTTHSIGNIVSELRVFSYADALFDQQPSKLGGESTCGIRQSGDHLRHTTHQTASSTSISTFNVPTLHDELLVPMYEPVWRRPDPLVLAAIPLMDELPSPDSPRPSRVAQEFDEGGLLSTEALATMSAALAQHAPQSQFLDPEVAVSPTWLPRRHSSNNRGLMTRLASSFGRRVPADRPSSHPPGHAHNLHSKQPPGSAPATKPLDPPPGPASAFSTFTLITPFSDSSLNPSDHHLGHASPIRPHLLHSQSLLSDPSPLHLTTSKSLPQHHLGTGIFNMCSNRRQARVDTGDCVVCHRTEAHADLTELATMGTGAGVRGRGSGHAGGHTKASAFRRVRSDKMLQTWQIDELYNSMVGPSGAAALAAEQALETHALVAGGKDRVDPGSCPGSHTISVVDPAGLSQSSLDTSRSGSGREGGFTGREGGGTGITDGYSAFGRISALTAVSEKGSMYTVHRPPTPHAKARANRAARWGLMHKQRRSGARFLRTMLYQWCGCGITLRHSAFDDLEDDDLVDSMAITALPKELKALSVRYGMGPVKQRRSGDQGSAAGQHNNPVMSGCSGPGPELRACSRNGNEAAATAPTLATATAGHTGAPECRSSSSSSSERWGSGALEAALALSASASTATAGEKATESTPLALNATPTAGKLPAPQPAAPEASRTASYPPYPVAPRKSMSNRQTSLEQKLAVVVETEASQDPQGSWPPERMSPERMSPARHSAPTMAKHIGKSDVGSSVALSSGRPSLRKSLSGRVLAALDLVALSRIGSGRIMAEPLSEAYTEQHTS